VQSFPPLLVVWVGFFEVIRGDVLVVVVENILAVVYGPFLVMVIVCQVCLPVLVMHSPVVVGHAVTMYMVDCLVAVYVVDCLAAVYMVDCLVAV
jgi:hypothetical protein